MINWFLQLFKKLPKTNTIPKTGDWLIFIDDVDVDFTLCKTSLKYREVVKLIEIKKLEDIHIVDVGLRFKDPNQYSTNSFNGCNIPGQGIRWIKYSRFRIATPEEVNSWMMENDTEYRRDQKLNQILDK